VVIKEGEVHNRIFQIARGSCRIEKNQKDKDPIVLGRMENNEPFGEISFLQGGAATASGMYQ
jgi:CRP-like cAMP-binding protein